jgi:hypothetical protein
MFEREYLGRDWIKWRFPGRPNLKWAHNFGKVRK